MLLCRCYLHELPSWHVSLTEHQDPAFVAGSISRAPMVSGRGGILFADCFELMMRNSVLSRSFSTVFSLYKCYTVLEVFLAAISALGLIHLQRLVSSAQKWYCGRCLKRRHGSSDRTMRHSGEKFFRVRDRAFDILIICICYGDKSQTTVTLYPSRQVLVAWITNSRSSQYRRQLINRASQVALPSSLQEL